MVPRDRVSRFRTAIARWLVRPTLLERAIALWLFFAVAACAKTFVQPDEHTVYPIFAQAARDWWGGEPLYANQAYFYSPTFAVAMSAFAWLPDQIGGIAWQIVSITTLLVALRAFYQQFLSRSFGQRWEPLYLTLCLIASVRGIWSAQSNTLLLAMLLFATVAAARGRWWRAAFFLAVPVHIKLWPVALAGLFALRWPQKLAARYAVVVLALALVPFLAAAPKHAASSYGDWYAALTARHDSGMRFPGYRDAWTIADTLGFTVQQPAQRAVQMTAGMVVLIWTLWLSRRRIPLEQTIVLTLAGWAAWQVLLGPGSERLTYLLLAPTLSWAIVQAFHQRCGRALAVCAYAAAFVLGSGAVERGLTPLFSAAVIIQPCGALLFVVWLVLYGGRTAAQQSHADAAGTVIEYRVVRNRRSFDMRARNDIANSLPMSRTSHDAAVLDDRQARGVDPIEQAVARE
jgi:hypothetical protein